MQLYVVTIEYLSSCVLDTEEKINLRLCILVEDIKLYPFVQDHSPHTLSVITVPAINNQNERVICQFCSTDMSKQKREVTGKFSLVDLRSFVIRCTNLVGKIYF